MNDSERECSERESSERETPRSRLDRRKFVLGAAGAVGGAAIIAACGGKSGTSLSEMPTDALGVAKARGLSSADVLAAVKTYVPSGTLDTHYLLASGGHSGQVWVLGVPSMRVLKTIPVFSHSSYQGWGYHDGSKEILAEGRVNGAEITCGDTHHPALSETNGDYDGEMLFINDKTNARVAVVDLRDFSTKQIVKNPLVISNHGSCFVTPNTEYVIETSQYASPLGWGFAPMTQASYDSNYRGAMTFWKFNRGTRKIDPSQSFAIELPPYFQDLADAGKLASDGWAFCNSFNTERAIVGTGTPLEVATARNDMDYLHVVNWKAAEKAVKAGMAKKVNGIPLISMDMAAKMGILFLIPEPKSPHGVDVTPNGEYIVVNGKLDPHVTIYSFKKIQDAIAAKEFTRDPYGLPIIDFRKVVEAQVELGLGPLHTQFDNNGYAYTSLFLASQVVRWSLGGSYRKDGWKVIDYVPIQYNVGHLCALHGDTVKPQGNYLVALNKWSLSEFLSTGPHHTVNLQLIDISRPGKMQVLASVPVPDGEPHFAQMIEASKLNPLHVYPMGWNAETWSKDPKATTPGKAKIVRSGKTVEVFATVMRSNIKPDLVEVDEGDTVIWHISNIETAENASHGFTIPAYDRSVVIDPGQVLHVTITADKAGSYPFYCTEFCSALHLEMMGYLLVKPA